VVTAKWRGLRHPEAGHDGGAAPYFEGWYVKLVSADRATRLAVIPGLFRGSDGSAEAFVQVLDGATGRSWYVPYPPQDYRAATGGFGITVGPNRFRADGVTLSIPEAPDAPALVGSVRYTDPLDQWPVTLAAPGAMGWYAYMPFMECYHGVVSFGHGLAGGLDFSGAHHRLDGGLGYIEQDWGQAFPSGYVWLHSNHFRTPRVSLMASVALIPWLRGTFRGLLIGVRTPRGVARFATYTGARSRSLEIDDEHVRLVVANRSGTTLELAAERLGGALLHAPVRTEMHKRVEESLGGTIAMTVRDRSGRVLFADVGEVAGMEVHGDIAGLLATADK
jgi:hypothetical protein